MSGDVGMGRTDSVTQKASHVVQGLRDFVDLGIGQNSAGLLVFLPRFICFVFALPVCSDRVSFLFYFYIFSVGVLLFCFPEASRLRCSSLRVFYCVAAPSLILHRPTGS